MTQVRWPNKFLEIHNLLKSIQGKIDNLNNSGDVQVLASQSSLIFQGWLLAITKALPGRSLVKADFSTWCKTMNCSFWKKLQARARALLASHALMFKCILSQVFSVGGLSTWGFGWGLPQVPLLRLGGLETVFLTITWYSVLFYPIVSLLSLSGLRVHSIIGTTWFCLSKWWTEHLPPSVLITWTDALTHEGNGTWKSKHFYWL